MVDEGGEHPRQSCDTLPNLLSLIFKKISFVVDFWLIKELFLKKWKDQLYEKSVWNLSSTKVRR